MDNIKKHPTRPGRYIGYDAGGYAWRIRRMCSTWYAHSIEHPEIAGIYAPKLWVLASHILQVNAGALSWELFLEDIVNG